MNKTERIEELLALLPQGSGFNCKWDYKELKNGSVVFFTDYHNMDQQGGYDGYTSIRMKVEEKELFEKVPDFKTFLNGKKCYRDQSTREYYEDIIDYALRYPNKI